MLQQARDVVGHMEVGERQAQELLEPYTRIAPSFTPRIRSVSASHTHTGFGFFWNRTRYVSSDRRRASSKTFGSVISFGTVTVPVAAPPASRSGRSSWVPAWFATA